MHRTVNKMTAPGCEVSRALILSILSILFILSKCRCRCRKPTYHSGRPRPPLVRPPAGLHPPGPTRPQDLHEISRMRIAIGSDHAGYDYKTIIIEAIQKGGKHEIVDFGTDSAESVDYPTYIRPVAEAVARGEFERGIVLGGSGNGEAIVANRVRGVRCTLCWNEDSARLARQHNDANVLSLGERMMTPEMALTIVGLWLETPFDGGRHARRIAMIDQ